MDATGDGFRVVSEVGETVAMSRLLDAWDGVVGTVEDGYWLGIDEYRHDIAVRGVIERRLAESDVPAWCLERLAEIDRRFRRLLLPEPARAGVPWWEAHVRTS
ncbi:hypothetical protein [Saccharothrix coeruleofusca]|uniref:Uncharacterized protein n=1 Tax=Saccharothrix coeruleofusca TaxID=33919 RepID=A0A918ANA3_9PSEU|nr:hypothetical protein [Saccharothrix coeruleofusca]GGP49441.1 hypothetical protein GCM10010185_22020 [Saccharothrix coeruleofusca]